MALPLFPLRFLEYDGWKNGEEAHTVVGWLASVQKGRYDEDGVSQAEGEDGEETKWIFYDIFLSSFPLKFSDHFPQCAREDIRTIGTRVLWK